MPVKKDRKIAILAPVAWRTPPRQYGAWETVASNVCEGLAARGWDVTLFATKDSITAGRLHAVVDRGYEEDPQADAKVLEYLHNSEVMEHAGEFDLIHNHFDFAPLTYSRLIDTPIVTTIHGFSSARILPVYQKYADIAYYVSITDHDRHPSLPYLGTVYNGIDLTSLTFRDRPGEKLVFLGRIHPDKGVHLAIEVAVRAKRELLIAGIIQDPQYFEAAVRPHVDGRQIQYIGPVGPVERDELFGQASALLHLNTRPEPFGLVIVEAMAAGVPVISLVRSACDELIVDGQTGFIVPDVDQAVEALGRVHEIDRIQCRRRVEECFSIDSMVSGYEFIYQRVFELEASRRCRHLPGARPPVRAAERATGLTGKPMPRARPSGDA